MARLTGPELVEFVKANPNMDRSELIQEAGYFKEKKDGHVTVQTLQFFEALTEANKISVKKPASRSTNGNGKTRAKGQVKTTKLGTLPVSRAYLGQIGIGEGEYAKITVEDDNSGQPVAVVIEKAPVAA